MRLLLCAGIAAVVAGLIMWILASIYSGGGVQIHGIGIVLVGPVPIMISGDSTWVLLFLSLLLAVLAIVVATSLRIKGFHKPPG